MIKETQDQVFLEKIAELFLQLKGVLREQGYREFIQNLCQLDPSFKCVIELLAGIQTNQHPKTKLEQLAQYIFQQVYFGQQRRMSLQEQTEPSLQLLQKYGFTCSSSDQILRIILKQAKPTLKYQADLILFLTQSYHNS